VRFLPRLAVAGAALSALGLAAAPANAGEPSIYNYLFHDVSAGQAQSSQCFGVTHPGGADDFGITDSTCLFDAQNEWYIENAANGTVKLKQRQSGRYLEQTATGISVQPASTADSQRWTFKRADTDANFNFVSIVNVATGQYLTRSTPHYVPAPFAGAGNDAQRWSVQQFPVAF
jgi:hypothetical protein